MDYFEIFNKLEQNGLVFKQLLSGIEPDEYLWKQSQDKWCMLEIICHLYDEECEDFRIRLRYVLEDPDRDPPKINPVAWVRERSYLAQNFTEVLLNFEKERRESVKWLRSLQNPKWSNAYEHRKFGNMSGHMYLSNWLAHDFLHIKQITRLKYDYLKFITGESLVYAGEWK